MNVVHTLGADYSSYQGKVDWHAQKRAGIRFAAIKATEGLEFQDPFFFRNWAQTHNHGIVRMAYHFLRANLNGAAQADHLHAYVRANGRFRYADGILLDFETEDGAPVGAALEQAERFVLRARATIAKQVILYTFPAFWQWLGQPLSPILASCPFWIADTGVLVPPLLPNLPSPAFWQFSSTSLLPGTTDGRVDMDLFYGGIVQLEKLMRVPAMPLVREDPATPAPETIPSGQFGKFGASPDINKVQ